MRNCHSDPERSEGEESNFLVILRNEESNNYQLSIVNYKLNSPLPIATLPLLLSSRTRGPMLLRGIYSLSLSLSQKLCQFPSF